MLFFSAAVNQVAPGLARADKKHVSQEFRFGELLQDRRALQPANRQAATGPVAWYSVHIGVRCCTASTESPPAALCGRPALNVPRCCFGALWRPVAAVGRPAAILPRLPSCVQCHGVRRRSRRCLRKSVQAGVVAIVVCLPVAEIAHVDGATGCRPLQRVGVWSCLDTPS